MSNHAGDQIPLNSTDTTSTRDIERKALKNRMSQQRSGRYIRTYSIITFVFILITSAFYVSFSTKTMKKYTFAAGSSVARANFFVVTLATLILPWMCQMYINQLASAVSGQFVSERAHTAQEAFVLVTVNLSMKLDLRQYAVLLRPPRTHRDVRIVLFIRLIGDWIVQLGVPFVTLALTYKVVEGHCFLGYRWEWLLLGLLWPSLWTVAILIYLIKFWKCNGYTRGAEISGVSAALQAALYFRLIVQEAAAELDKLDWLKADFTNVTGRWKLGFQVTSRGEGEEAETYLGLVREEHCVSFREYFGVRMRV